MARVEPEEFAGFLETDGGAFIARLEGLLQEEEGALAELEGLTADHRWAMADAEPQAFLDGLQRVEEVLGRAQQLDAARAALAARLTANGNRFSGTGPLGAAGDADPAAVARLVALRHRILGVIASIAERNEANGHLVAGLTRVVSARAERLSRLQDTSLFDQSLATGRGPKGKGLAAVDVMA